MQESLPGLLAMFFIALFSNNLAGSPNPLTLENLFSWLDAVIGPVIISRCSRSSIPTSCGIPF